MTSLAVIGALIVFILWLWQQNRRAKEQDSMLQAFKALSSDVLDRTNRSFLDLATATFEKYQETTKGELEKRQQTWTELMSPVKETLGKLDAGMHRLETERKTDQELLKGQLRSLVEAENKLRSETSQLVKALRAPLSRGRWGEMQLRRVVELAGMLNFCDFYEQEVGEEIRVRPDLLVRLPGGRQVVVDAKVPLEAYLEAIEAVDDDVKIVKFRDHARQVRSHVSALSRKSYWEAFQPTPEFVILFLPSETIFSAALEHDPSLIEVGADQSVILATPTTLIALLRSVAYGWKQEGMSRHAEQVSDLGRELYKRVNDMSEHFAKMGRSLGSAVEAYNKGMGSLESRVLTCARKFKDLEVAPGGLELEPVELIERTPREPSGG